MDSESPDKPGSAVFVKAPLLVFVGLMVLLAGCNLGFEQNELELGDAGQDIIDQRDDTDPGDATDQDIQDRSYADILDVADEDTMVPDARDMDVSKDQPDPDVPDMTEVSDMNEMPDMKCETTVIRLGPQDADLGLGWEITASVLFPEEGDVLAPPQDGNTPARFAVDVPCDDDYHVWIRMLDDQSNDSLLVQVDTMPAQPVITAVDCDTTNPPRYKWGELNWRDANEPQCIYVQDPWVQTWTAGQHIIEFTPRETNALARIIVTNDDAFIPSDSD